jgi:hypothetical protein
MWRLGFDSRLGIYGEQHLFGRRSRGSDIYLTGGGGVCVYGFAECRGFNDLWCSVVLINLGIKDRRKGGRAGELAWTSLPAVKVCS